LAGSTSHQVCPLIDKNGNYLGTLKITGGIGEYKRIEGEKRLLDWRDWYEG